MKNTVVNVLLIISVLLTSLFVITLFYDYLNYNPIITSAPFYINVIIRFFEFLFPAIILYLLRIYFKRK